MGTVEITLIVFIVVMTALAASSLLSGLRRRGRTEDAAKS